MCIIASYHAILYNICPLANIYTHVITATDTFLAHYIYTRVPFPKLADNTNLNSIKILTTPFGLILAVLGNTTIVHPIHMYECVVTNAVISTAASLTVCKCVPVDMPPYALDFNCEIQFDTVNRFFHFPLNFNSH